jgi:hypothetical protein
MVTFFFYFLKRDRNACDDSYKSQILVLYEDIGYYDISLDQNGIFYLLFIKLRNVK